MKSGYLISFGIFLTVFFLSFCVWMSFQEVCIESSLNQTVCKNNYQWFLNSTPNEKGDTLAGIAGSLAFLWIIVTVLLQANELSLQRQELSQTRSALEKQTQFLSNQDDDRRVSNIDAQIDAKLKLLNTKLSGIAFDRFYLVRGSNPREWKDVPFLSKNNYSVDHPPERYTAAIKAVTDTIEKFVSEGWEVYSPSRPTQWSGCAQIAKEICDLDTHASEGKQDEVRYGLQIGAFRKTINKALSNDSLWGTHQGKPSS